MYRVIGPVLARNGGYAFDLWTPEKGLSPGYVYPRVEDAHYARNAEMRSCNNELGGYAVGCNTGVEFLQ